MIQTMYILIWVEKAPKYKEDSDDDIISFINNHVSCSKSNELKELINLQIATLTALANCSNPV
jgi:hypothetical protein